MDVTTLNRAVYHFFGATDALWSGHTLLMVHHVIGWLLVTAAVAYVLLPDRSERLGGGVMQNRIRRLLTRLAAVGIAVAIVVVVVLGYGSTASAAVPASPAVRAPVEHTGSILGSLPGPVLVVFAGVCFVSALLVIVVVRFAVGAVTAVIRDVGRSTLPALFVTITLVVVLAAALG